MIRGRVIYVGQPASGVSKTGKQWSKQEFAIETEGQYPKKVAFGVMNGKFTMNMGDVVEVEVDAQSREYQGRWYTELTAWRCNNFGAAQQPMQQPVYQQQAPAGYQQPPYPTAQPYQPAPAQNDFASQFPPMSNNDVAF